MGYYVYYCIYINRALIIEACYVIIIFHVIQHGQTFPDVRLDRPTVFADLAFVTKLRLFPGCGRAQKGELSLAFMKGWVGSG